MPDLQELSIACMDFSQEMEAVHLLSAPYAPWFSGGAEVEINHAEKRKILHFHKCASGRFILIIPKSEARPVSIHIEGIEWKILNGAEARPLDEFLLSLEPEALAGILEFLPQSVNRAAIEARISSSADPLSLTRIFYLSSRIVYMESPALPKSGKVAGGGALGPSMAILPPKTGAVFFILSGVRMFSINLTAAQDISAFFAYLSAKPEKERLAIIESVLTFALKNPAFFQRFNEAAALCENLQLLAPVETRMLADKNHPVRIDNVNITALPPEALFISGTWEDSENLIEEMELISVFGFTIPLLKHVTRFSSRFAAFAPLPSSSLFHSRVKLRRFRLRLRLKGGVVISLFPPLAKQDAYEARREILSAFPADLSRDALATLFPAMRKAQAGLKDENFLDEIISYGEIPSAPEVSVIVPLYMNLEFLQLQFVKWAGDPEMSRAEIIFVLDSPQIARKTKRAIKTFSLIYGISAKLILMNQNAGFSGACNYGARYARGELLVFHNSDVFPKEKGWLGRLTRFHRKSPNPGVTGCKLLYEDGSVQHAGIYFGEAEGMILGGHLHEGMSENYPPACVSRPLTAVTGALMMVEKKKFLSGGGFSTEYYLGDFEDMDLCLSFMQRGHENRYCAEVTLYHLQRRSLSLHGGYTKSAWQFNAELFNFKWSEFIKTLSYETKQAKAS